MKISFKSIWTKFLNLWKSNPGFRAVFAAIIVIIILFLVYGINNYFGSKGYSYAISYGIIIGLLCGYILQSNISKNIKIGTVGVFSGMGLDFIANAVSPAGREDAFNAIDSVGYFISTTSANIFAVDTKKLEHFISLGLWIFFLTVVLVLILANILDAKKDK